VTFNVKKFMSENFSYREKEIEGVEPDLKNYNYGKKGKAKFKVRGLTGIELATVRDAVSQNQDIESLIEMLGSNISRDKVDAFKDAFGMSGKAPADWVRRVAILRLGCVDPEMQQDEVVKFGETFPITFSKLTDEIMILSGQGKLGESTASGATRK
jgi:hypothetical protein